MDKLRASTLVYADKTEVYEFLKDFRSYSKHSDYVKEVIVKGDGTPGTEYNVVFEKEFLGVPLSYTAKSRKIYENPPEEIGWEVIRHVDAEGGWNIESVSSKDEDKDEITRIELEIEVDRDSAKLSALPTPPLTPVDWLIEKLQPMVIREAENILVSAINEIEGQKRTPEIDFHETTGIFSDLRSVY